MSEPQDPGRLLDAAEQAAVAGDLASADDLLRRAARIQETELGPLHPDLADTLNNLAIVAEQVGRLDDAEALYRRAVAIASASLSAEDPKSQDARKNLADFCRARGVAIEPPAPATAPATVETPAARAPAAPPVAPPAASPSRTRTPIGTIVVAAVAVLVTAVLLVMRPWSSREPPSAAPATPAKPAAVEQSRPPAVVPPGGDRVPGGKPPVSTGSPGTITLAAAQLCRTFSQSGAAWTCDPIANPASPGSIVLYTRVRSAGDAVVVHRWYREDVLRKSATLRVGANATEGYRTYSRQTVGRGEQWRVEVRTAEGAVLFERRLAVK